MTDDHASAELASEPDHHPTKGDSQTEQASGSRIKKIAGTLLKGWRALAFLLIVLIVGSYAFHYKALSDPGSENTQLANHAPQEIDLFVSNPNVSIDVNTSVGQSTAAPEVEDLTMTVHAPSSVKTVTILMLSSISTEPGEEESDEIPSAAAPSKILIFSPYSSLENNPPPGMELPPEPQIIGHRFAIVISDAPQMISFDGFSYFIGNDTEQTKAYFYGHLPAIGSMDQSAGSDPTVPDVLAETYKNAPHLTRDIVLYPWIYNPYFHSNFFSSSFKFSELLNPKSYKTPYGGPGELFWTPAHLSITETQEGIASIANQQVNYITPGGEADGFDYTWRGSTSLEPVFQTTNDGALQSESNDAFLSGILFGIAGAAAIAFVQEIPEAFSRPVWWSRRKRRRASSSENPADRKPDAAGAKTKVDAKTSNKTARSSTGLGWPPSN